MRTKSELFDLDKVTILLQYLYMDENNTIIFNNGVADLEIKMDEEYNFYVLNHNFPHLGYSSFTEMMTVPAILIIVRTLGETSPLNKEIASNRWEEIEKITKANLGLNYRSPFRTASEKEELN